MSIFGSISALKSVNICNNSSKAFKIRLFQTEFLLSRIHLQFASLQIADMNLYPDILIQN